MKRLPNASAGSVGCSFVIIWMFLTIIYWGISGATTKYTIDFWASVMAKEEVSVKAWPCYVGGGFLSGVPIVTGGITYLVDSTNQIEGDPYP